MAYITTTALSGSLRDRADRILARLGRGFEAWVRAYSRRDQIERLQALSDTELAALGLTRDQIVMHVYRDRMCV